MIISAEDYKKIQVALRSLYQRFFVIRMLLMMLCCSYTIVIDCVVRLSPNWPSHLIIACLITYMVAGILACYQAVCGVVLTAKCYFVKVLSTKRVKHTADNRLWIRGPLFRRYYLDTEVLRDECEE